MPTSRRLPVYALIIAVNGDGLVAPEADALRLQHTLSVLGVHLIEMLIGPNATRSNIIRYLLDLTARPSIPKNAPILIFFAGHGRKGELSIPGVGRREVEYLVPFDGLQSHRRRVPPIPDITISALLGKIAESKGNHITFILDCCYSGGGSRGGNADGFSPQPPEDQPDFDTATLEQEDGELWSEFLSGPGLATTEQNARAASSNPHSFRYQGVTSHVLLASCHAREKSYEHLSPLAGEAPRGVFTDSLIMALEDCREDKMFWNITYSALFNRIKEIMRSSYSEYPQTPQLEGYHRDRHVFATPAFPHQHHAVAPITHERGVYALPIGSLAGVHQGAFFEIYDYPKGQRKLIGRFQISALNEIRTNIAPGRDLRLGPDAYAVLCAPPIRLPVSMSSEFTPYWNHQDLQAALESHLGRQYAITQYITPVRPGERSKLQISISQRNGIQVQTESGSVITIPNSRHWASHLSAALTKAIKFYHHLEQASVTSNHTSQLFEVQVLELSPTIIEGLPVDEVGEASALAPRRGRDPIILRPNNETRIMANHPPETEFGLRVLNRTNDSYFIYIFYFDPNDFSITSMYMPSSSDPIPPLSGGRDLTVGYGHHGAAPLQFTIDAHLARDPGFFKLYFSHYPIDMSTIQQDGFDSGNLPRPQASPFSNSSPPFGSVLYPITVLNPNAQHVR